MAKKATMAGTRIKIYVGVKGVTRKVFRSFTTPTKTAYGDRFSLVIGPFRTLRGAHFMADYGRNNPHLQTVQDAEELAKMEAERQSFSKSLKKAIRRSKSRGRR